MQTITITADLPDEFIDITASVKGYGDSPQSMTKEDFVSDYYLRLITEDMKFCFEVNERKQREAAEKLARDTASATIDSAFSAKVAMTKVK